MKKILILFYIILCSCPISIDENICHHIMDDISPRITIFSPKANSICGDVVEVRGMALDYLTNTDIPGKIVSLDYEVPDSIINGKIPIKSNGSFSFRFMTSSLLSKFKLNIKASDSRGNVKLIGLPLKKIVNNGIPSFKVIPGNKKITLQWSSLPGIDKYSLYYSENMSMPDEKNGTKIENITSPATLINLTNGKLYNFQLKRNSQKGIPASYSDYLKAIPLSEQTLAPRVIAGYKEIRIEWNPVQASKEYEVWKALSPQGPYRNLSGVIQKNFYIDKELEKSRWFYYKIKPKLPGARLSMFNGAQTLPFFTKSPEVISKYSTGHFVRDVCINGNFAYIADDKGGVKILDIRKPSFPKLIATCNTAGLAFAIDISGHYAYVAVSGIGLQLIDITDPYKPLIYNPVAVKGDFSKIAYKSIHVQAGYAYITDASSGLHIFDIRNPEKIKPLDQEIFVKDSTNLVLSGDYVYVSSYQNGIYIINIQNPEKPHLAGIFKKDLHLWDMAIKDNFIYGADRKSGFHILDISSPEKPEIIKSIYTSEYFFKVHVKDNTAYLASSSSGFFIFDIYNPETPVFTGVYKTFGTILNLDVKEKLAYLACSSKGLWVFDIQDLNSVRRVKVFSLNLFRINCKSMAMSERYAYLVGKESFHIFDIQDQENPVFIHTYKKLGDPIEICLNGHYAYILDNKLGLQIIDLLDPEKPVFFKPIGIDISKGLGACISVNQGFAYIITHLDFNIYDIQDPQNPISFNNHQLLPIGGIYVRGKYVYTISEYEGGLQILDVSNPAIPVLVGECPLSGKKYDIQVRGDFAYVAAGKQGMFIIDISMPESPALVASCDTSGIAYRIILKGKYAFVLGQFGGFYIINILDPENPVMVRSYKSFGPQYDVSIMGHYAYILNTNGLVIIDLKG